MTWCRVIGFQRVGAVLLAVGCGDGLWAAGQEEARFALAKDGRAACAIAVDCGATPTVAFAAQELKRHLEMSTGAPFALVTNGVSTISGPTVEVGTGRAREMLGAAAWDALGREDSVTYAKGSSLAICGNSDAGVLYGVYAFLEREVGCRWYTQTGVNRVPEDRSLAVSRASVRTSPSYPHRWILCADTHSCCRCPHGKMFLLRNRLNMVETNWEWMPPGFGAPQAARCPRR